MSMSDPLADFLTRIRNGIQANFTSVDIPLSKLKVRVADVLKKEGYIADYHVADQGVQGTLTIDLKYGPNNEKVITGIRRVSKPGLRQYKKSDAIPKVMSGLGVAVLSTSHGVISDREAKKLNVGGELLCEVW
ncbi:small subunit ribosomal protein S8 [Candidatus Electrothrix marina]|uniref:Small ribosomal subunit protein uS8 n=1 Tax=Candidatus Electrothrix marina TaxID=1859130 RepID=A0A3S3QNM4_9BACT|nr:small subunit ribosomal protein S8 [Candidatus Electrothrix marina]RWX49526.1 small subunit ribosomal protein S8 [Candidatus Electrothrix marina]RWX51638.1 small subunit ribosomal protein S8 [Candidatus Electrothrix marina]